MFFFFFYSVFLSLNSRLVKEDLNGNISSNQWKRPFQHHLTIIVYGTAVHYSLVKDLFTTLYRKHLLKEIGLQTDLSSCHFDVPLMFPLYLSFRHNISKK